MLEIIDPGPQATIQDYPGRIGLASRGVFPAGPVDDLAFRLANVLVGNEPGAAAVEIPTGKFAVKAHFRGLAALCGTGDPTLNGAPVPKWEAIELAPGDVLACAASAGAGFRLYLAV